MFGNCKPTLQGLLLLGMGLLLWSPEAQAGHFRGGTLRYEAIPPTGGATTSRKVRIIIETFFQRDYSSWGCPKTKSCLNKTINIGTIYPGDGKTINADVKIFFDDIKNNVIGARAIYIHTFAGKATVFKTYWKSCCWINSVKGPLGPDYQLSVDVNLNKNSSPTFNSPTFFEWCTTSPFFSNINATDPDKETITYRLLPFADSPTRRGMTIDQTGLISWPKPQAGDWVVSVEVKDKRGATSYRDFLLQIPKTCGNQVPVLSLKPSKISVKPGQPACTNVSVSDPDKTHDFELYINPTKPGATQAPTARLKNPGTFRYCWTPKQADLGLTHVILFTARDSGKPNLIAQGRFPVSVVTGFPPTLVIDPKGNPKTMDEGQTLKFGVVATDTDGNGISTFTSTGAPSFCTLSKTSGTRYDVECKPSFTDGTKTYKITFSATDKDTPPRSNTLEVQLEVKDFNRRPKVSLADQTLTESIPFKVNVTASDPDGDKLTFGMSGLPANANIDAQTGEITWTAVRSEVGNYTAKIKVSDSRGKSTEISVKFTVKRGNGAPVITSTPPKYAYTGIEMEYTLSATDPDNDPVTWALKTAPARVKIDSKTGRLLWKAEQAEVGKNIDFEVEGCDNGQPKACVTQKFTVAVKQRCLIDKDCKGTDICLLLPVHKPVWICAPAGCAPKPETCPKTEALCLNAKCAKNLCEGKKCSAGEVCRPSDGKCIKPCQGVQCAKGEVCVDGACTKTPCSALSCKADESCDASDILNPRCVKDPCAKQDSCKHGRTCFRGRCVDDPCPKMTCPNGEQRCVGGQCIERKSCKGDNDCPGDQICLNQKCYDPGCYKKPCPGAKLCLKGRCVDNPCESKSCKEGEVCRPADGACVPSCPQCGPGQVCIKGVCEDDDCVDKKCESELVCREGKCVKDACVGKDAPVCRLQRVCREGKCDDPLCVGMACPANYQCKRGVCVSGAPYEPNDAGEPVPEPTPDPTIPLVNGGCACDTRSNQAPWAFLGGLFLLLMGLGRGRRSRG